MMMGFYTAPEPAFTSADLSPHDRLLVNEGVLVEYAPGRVIPHDLVATPPLRGAVLRPLLKGAIAITLTASWIHSGWWPYDRQPTLCAAHPGRTREPVTFRGRIPEESWSIIGGQRVTTPARTAVDLLLLESPAHAFEGIMALLSAGLTVIDIEDQVASEHRRKNLPRARTIISHLAFYVERRDALLRRADETMTLGAP